MIMSVVKYPSLLSRQIEAIVYISNKCARCGRGGGGGKGGNNSFIKNTLKIYKTYLKLKIKKGPKNRVHAYHS